MTTPCLSCLPEIVELDLLRRLYGKVTITETIRKEAIHSSASESLRLLLLKVPDWISVVPDASSYLEETGALDAGKPPPSRSHGNSEIPAC